MSQGCKVSKLVPLTETVLDYLTTNDVIENENTSYNTIGGVLSNTKYIWYANGPRFQVINSNTGVKIAAWTFGSVLRDTTTKVVCVAEIPSSDKDLPLLAIGLECVLTGGSFCVFDLVTSKVLRAVQLENKVTNIHVIDSGIEIFPLFGPLRSFDGVLAVGCAGGDVLLIDLCRQSIDDARLVGSVHEIKDEINACQVVTLTFKDIDIIEYHKQRTVQYGSHLAIHVNAVLNSDSPHFVLKGPKDDDRIHVNKLEVAVSATYYCPQLGSLIIGYNFGALQIWNLINMSLIYTSPVYEENVPISHFTVQEPTDDPRAYCYLWAVYSNIEPNHIGYPVAVLYSLNYETKEWHEGYGYLYQDLQSCTVRFQTTLTSPRDKDQTPQGACCLRLSAFNKGYSSRSSMPESHEDTLTLCSIVWNVWFNDRTAKTYLSIFDLNQWYKEQMPSSPNPSTYQRYMYYVCLSDVLDFSLNQKLTLFDIHINNKSIRQFIGVQKPEEHYFPSTLSFESCVCSDKVVAFVYNQGHQRALITSLDSSGALVLLKPKDIYERAIKLGLTPLFSEFRQLPNIHFQREFILNVILEQQMVGWLCNCASSWCNGSYTSAGCSLDVFLTWSWSRASVLKANADQLCIPLFDYSYVKLDTNVKRILNNTIKQLMDLNIIYEYVCKKLENFLPNPDVVVEQRNSLRMVSLHLEVLQWLLNIGLLPENHVSAYAKDIQLESISAPYPVDCLVEYYNQRRVTLHELSNEKTSLLFIDNLIDIECGGAVLQKQWENDGGNGLYPPPSLQALLRTYLVDEVDLTYKHCVIIYVFLDLAMVLDHEKYKFVVTHLIKFPAVFKLSPSVIKITQAFWQLDHGDFEIAMEQLLDPLVSPDDLKPWHHRIILNALLAQKQHNFALLYLQVRRPSLSEVGDVYKIISLLVANNMLDEAFYFQRNNSTKMNEMDLLEKIFDECNKTNQIRKLISYGLNAKEEEALMNYLKRVNHAEYEEFQVIFYLQRSRYMEIFELQKRKLGQSGLVGQKNIDFQEEMVQTLSDFLPKVTRNIMNTCHQEKSNLWRQRTKPKPMSVFIHNTEEQAKYKSTLIHATLAKARQTWTKPVLVGKHVSEEIPFLRTPTYTPLPSRKRLHLICPKIISSDSIDFDESKPSPSKKMRLSARQSIDANTSVSSNVPNTFKLDTPIIKRRTSINDSKKSDEKYKICTPQSILKVRNLMTHSSQSSVESTSKTDLEDEFKKNLINVSTSSKGFCVTPRKSLSLVRFEKLNTSSDNTLSSNQSKKLHELSLISLPSSNSNENDKKRSLDENVSKNSSQSTDVYYSPDSSLSTGEVKDVSEGNIVTGEANATNNVESTPEFNVSSQSVRTDETDVAKVQSPKSKQSDLSTSSDRMQTRFKRRQLHENISKMDSAEKTSIGRKQSEVDDSKKASSPNQIYVPIGTKESDSSPSSDALMTRSSHSNSPMGRVTRRKSLSRRVLEHNAFSSMITSKSINTETWKSFNKKISETTTLSTRNATSDSLRTNKHEESHNKTEEFVTDLSNFESILDRNSCQLESSTLVQLQNSSFLSDNEAVGDTTDKNDIPELSTLQCPREKVTGRKSVHSVRSSSLFKPHDSSIISITIHDDTDEQINARESPDKELPQIIEAKNCGERSSNSEHILHDSEVNNDEMPSRDKINDEDLKSRNVDEMDKIERNKKGTVKGRKSVHGSTLLKQSSHDLGESSKVAATVLHVIIDDEHTKTKAVELSANADVNEGVISTDEIIADHVCENQDNSLTVNERDYKNDKSCFILDSDSEFEDLISKQMIESFKYSLAYLQNSSFLDDEGTCEETKGQETMDQEENDIDIVKDMSAMPHESGDVLLSSEILASDTAAINTYQSIGPDTFKESTVELEINNEELNQNENVEIIEIGGSTDESKEDSFGTHSSSNHSENEIIESDKTLGSKIEISSDSETSSDYDEIDEETQKNSLEESSEIHTEEREDNASVEDVAESVQEFIFDALHEEVLINDGEYDHEQIVHSSTEHVDREFDGRMDPEIPSELIVAGQDDNSYIANVDADIQLPIFENDLNGEEKIVSSVDQNELPQTIFESQAIEVTNTNCDDELPENSLTIEQKIESPTVINETDEINNPLQNEHDCHKIDTSDASDVGFVDKKIIDNCNDRDLHQTEIEEKTTILNVEKLDYETDNTPGTSQSTCTTPIRTSERMTLRKRALSTNSPQVSQPRSLRKRSASVEQQSETKLQFLPKEQLPTTPKNTKLKNVNLDFDSPRKRSLRSSSTDLKCPNESVNDVSKPRTRKASSISSFPITAVHKEQDKQILPKTRSHRSLSVTSLPVIEEDVNIADGDTRHTRNKNSKTQQTQPSDLSDTLLEYSSSRRLTRHQKGVLEKGIVDNAKKKAIKSKCLKTGEGVQELEELDPIKLLDQPAFEGKKDVEEQRILDSPPSSVSDTSPCERMKTRRMSHDSTSSLVSMQSFSEGGSPKRTRSKSERKLFDSPSTSGMKLRRRRTGSCEDSAGSEHSTTSKKGRYLKDKADHGETSTRNRSKTPDISDAESNTTRKSRRKLANLSKTALTEILEEKSEDSIKEERPITRGRTRKTSGT